MDGSTIARIIEASRALEPEEQGYFIAVAAIKASRAADAAISDHALEAEFRAFWRDNAPGAITVPAGHTVSIGLAWGRHLLRGGRHG
jgi:hypothetical protein